MSIAWKVSSCVSVGGAGQIVTEYNGDEELYRVSIDVVHKEYAQNQYDARRRLADKLDALARELRK